MKSYAQVRGHGPDFVVRYRLYPPSAGGRKFTLQHLRCDFLYEGDDPQTDGIFAIHPEFLDAVGVPLEKDMTVPLEGKASMWVLFPAMRGTVHRARIAVGVRGHFMEGARKVGDVEVIEIVGLHENPTS